MRRWLRAVLDAQYHGADCWVLLPRFMSFGYDWDGASPRPAPSSLHVRTGRRTAALIRFRDFTVL